MAWVAPRTWTPGEKVTAALMNAHVRDNLNVLRSEQVRRIASWGSTVGNIATGEDVLASKVLDVNQLSANDMSIRGLFGGLTANNGNTKTLRLRFKEGANNNLLYQMTLTVSEAGHWLIGFEVSRTGASSGRSLVQAVVGPANGPTSKSGTNATTGALSVTWANAVTVELSGEGTATDDIQMTQGKLLLVS